MGEVEFGANSPCARARDRTTSSVEILWCSLKALAASALLLVSLLADVDRARPCAAGAPCAGC